MAMATELEECLLFINARAEITSPSFLQHTPGTPQDEHDLGYEAQTLHIYQVALFLLATFFY